MVITFHMSHRLPKSVGANSRSIRRRTNGRTEGHGDDFGISLSSQTRSLAQRAQLRSLRSLRWARCARFASDNIEQPLIADDTKMPRAKKEGEN